MGNVGGALRSRIWHTKGRKEGEQPEEEMLLSRHSRYVRILVCGWGWNAGGFGGWGLTRGRERNKAGQAHCHITPHTLAVHVYGMFTWRRRAPACLHLSIASPS